MLEIEIVPYTRGDGGAILSPTVIVAMLEV